VVMVWMAVTRFVGIVTASAMESDGGI